MPASEVPETVAKLTQRQMTWTEVQSKYAAVANAASSAIGAGGAAGVYSSLANVISGAI